MNHANHPRLDADELTPAVLEGAVIYGPDDEKLGYVTHVHGQGNHAEVVLEVGGFLGIGAKSVAVPMAELDFMRDETGSVHALSRWTKEALKALPSHHH